MTAARSKEAAPFLLDVPAEVLVRIALVIDDPIDLVSFSVVSSYAAFGVFRDAAFWEQAFRERCLRPVGWAERLAKGLPEPSVPVTGWRRALLAKARLLRAVDAWHDHRRTPAAALRQSLFTTTGRRARPQVSHLPAHTTLMVDPCAHGSHGTFPTVETALRALHTCGTHHVVVLLAGAMEHAVEGVHVEGSGSFVHFVGRPGAVAVLSEGASWIMSRGARVRLANLQMRRSPCSSPTASRRPVLVARGGPREGTMVTMVDCQVLGSTLVCGEASLAAVECAFTDAAGHAIACRDHAELCLSRCVLFRSAGSGLCARDQSVVSLEQCALKGNKCGAQFLGSTTAMVTRCRVSGNGHNGISCFNSDQGLPRGKAGPVEWAGARPVILNGAKVVAHCRVENNAMAGVALAGCADVILRSNHIIDNEGPGVTAMSGALVELCGNSFAPCSEPSPCERERHPNVLAMNGSTVMLAPSAGAGGEITLMGTAEVQMLPAASISGDL